MVNERELRDHPLAAEARSVPLRLAAGGLTIAKHLQGEIFAKGASRALCPGVKVARCPRLREVWVDDVATLYCRGSKPNAFILIINLVTRRDTLRVQRREFAVIRELLRRCAFPFETWQPLLQLPSEDELVQENGFVDLVPKLEFCAAFEKPSILADGAGARERPVACNLFVNKRGGELHGSNLPQQVCFNKPRTFGARVGAPTVGASLPVPAVGANKATPTVGGSQPNARVKPEPITSEKLAIPTSRPRTLLTSRP